MSGIEGTTGEIIAPEIIDDFRALAELNDFIRDRHSTGGTEIKRDELADAIGEKILGRKIEVTELPIARETRERAIEYLTLANTVQNESMARAARTYNGNRRLHPATFRQYVTHDFFRHRRRVRGKIEGVDGPRASLVAQPRSFIGLLDRAWIKVVNDNGEQLVDIKITENPQSPSG